MQIFEKTFDFTSTVVDFIESAFSFVNKKKKEPKFEDSKVYRSLYKYAIKFFHQKCKFLVDGDGSLSLEDIVQETLFTGYKAYLKAKNEKGYEELKAINYGKRAVENQTYRIINKHKTKKRDIFFNDGSFGHKLMSIDAKVSADSEVTGHNFIPSDNDTEGSAGESSLFEKLRSVLSDTEINIINDLVEGPDFLKTKQNVKNYVKFFNSISKHHGINPERLRSKLIKIISSLVDSDKNIDDFNLFVGMAR